MNTADVFCDARRRGQGISHWPGNFPAGLDAAYAIQREAIAKWGDRVAGLKVGRITGAAAGEYGKDRFIGPILESTIVRVQDRSEALFPILPGGSAALECELVCMLRAVDVHKAASGGRAALIDIVDEWHIGIEIAGSPMNEIDALGPLASVACFGNNNGLILGPAILDWRERELDAITCVTLIDGVEVGRDTPARLPGGVWTALAFALAEAGQRGIALTPSFVISTGAITGMHAIRPKSRAVADFGDFGRIDCVGHEAEQTA